MTGRTNDRRIIRGCLRLAVRRPGGTVVARRQAANTVVRSGAELVAELWSGQVSTPVNGMAVGLDDTPSSPPYEITALTTTTPTGDPAILRPAVALRPEDLTTEVLADELKVRVSLRAVVPPDQATSPDEDNPRVMIAEAALGVLAAEGDRLTEIYNRVVFEPVPKTADHELALYWEIDFPYGA